MPTAPTSTTPTTICWKAEVEAEQHHARLQRLDDQRADERAVDRADAPGERGAADNRRRDHVKLVELAEHVGRGVEPRRIDAGGDPRQRAHQRKDENCDLLGVDASKLGGFRVAAGGVDIAAEPGPPCEEGHDEAGDERDQHRNRVSGGNEQSAFRHGDIVVGRVFCRHPLRPGIGVDDRGRAEDEEAADDRDDIFGPHRPLRETEPRPPLPSGVQAEHDACAADRGQRPTRRRSDRAMRPPAHQREAVVERGDRLTRRHPPGRAAPEQLPAKGDDEGRNADVGDQRALKGADRRADRQGEDDGDDPDRRIVEPEIDRQDADLGDANDCRDEAHDRSDREIDVAHDDDEHHAGRHDRDRRRLDAQIPQVARRQEHALAGLNQGVHVEPDPDQRQRADHAEHAGVDLGGSQQPSDRRLVGSRAGRARRRRGHAPSRSSPPPPSGRAASQQKAAPTFQNGAASFCFTPSR